MERGRDMYSAVLYKEEFLRITHLVKSSQKPLERALGRCSRQLLELKRECEGGCKLDTIGSFSLSLIGLLGELENCLETQEHGYLRRELLEFYFQVRSFLDVYDLLDENYVIYSQHDAQGRFGVKLYCVNPAANLQRCMDKGSSAVFFSATLLPIRYYKTLLSTRTDNYAIYARSPFDPAKKKLLIARDVSSRYTRRNEQEYYGIAEYIHQVISAHQGNYMIFFPSYKMMEDVYAVYEENFRFFGIHVMLQQPHMREDEKEIFLQRFEQEGQYLLGFCVMGGIFSEGIDLVGEKLVGALIVGTGLPQISYERELLREFYEERGENGFDYAYRFPGMNKVLQSAGRVIRTQDDRGVIALLDERFGYAEYKNLFPREWSEYSFCSRSNVRRQVEAFWSRAAVREVSDRRDQ